MKFLATLVLLASLAPAVRADVIHDEAVNGDLSSDPAFPTPVVFAGLSSTIHGTTGSSGGVVDRDYITFTIAPDRLLSGLVLRGLSPDNLAFASFNSGATSFVPSGATSGSFLAGIHISAAHVDQPLMPLFVTESVTTNSLAFPFLMPGTYCFLIQQTSAISQSYSLEFESAFVLPVLPETWGGVKARYR